MVERLLLATSWHRSAVFDQFWALARSLEESGTEIHWLDDRRHLDASPDPWITGFHQWPGTGRPQGLTALRYADRLVHDIRPTVVIANFAAVTPLGLAAWRAGVERRISWYHSVSEAFSMDTSRVPIARRALGAAKVQGRRVAYRRYTDVVAVAGAAAADYLALYRTSGPALHVRHNAVADGPHRSTPPGPDAPLVAAGRLEPWKGMDVLVRAASHLDAPRRLVIFGEGGQREHLARLAQELGVDLHLPGSTERHVVREQMAAAAAVVVPSRADAFPMVAIEGLASGVPIVASETGGLTEAVRHDDTGMLVPPDDPEALAAALEAVLDPVRNGRMGRAARQDFLHRFEVQHWGADLADRLRSGRPLGS
ncbi:MAG: hypothetical protein JWO77_3311 [Ilumatobacteraceae bacterium]|nr:hypothetical protein [Ilumatobacteraceae bacterium]